MKRHGEYGYGALDESQSSLHEPELGEQQFRSLIEKTGSNIQNINGKVSSVERSVRQIGTSSDSVNLRNSITSVLQGINQNVGKTQVNIRHLKEMSRTLSKENRLQEERITSQFMDTVQRVSEVQKKVANQMKTYPDLPKPSPFSSEEQYQDDDFGSRGSEPQDQMQKQEDEMQYDLTLLEERERQVRDIESAIVDVNEIFRDLSTMVMEQGDLVDSIEANVEMGSDNVDSARQELRKAEMYQKKARRKQCCIIVTLIIVVIIVAIIIIIIVKK